MGLGGLTVGRQTRKSRPASYGGAVLVSLTAVLAILLAIEWAYLWSMALGHEGTFGLDLTIYQERVDGWLAGDGLYRATQLAGPYTITHGDAMYPPPILLLLLPARIVPALWWVIPIGLTLAAYRPPRWAWPLVLLALLWPRTGAIYLYGNPAMWSVAFLAAGTRWGWTWALAALKPIAAPFALLGVRDRRWWVGFGVGLAACLAFLPMWPDYVRALLNARSGDALYLLGDLPILAVAVLPFRR